MSSQSQTKRTPQRADKKGKAIITVTNENNTELGEKHI
jgi:hypothetical protein